MHTIILFTGFAGSGKSTTASKIETRYGGKRFAYAAKLKEVCVHALKDLFGFSVPLEHMYDQKEKEKILYHVHRVRLAIIVFFVGILHAIHNENYHAVPYILAFTAVTTYSSFPILAAKPLSIRWFMQYMGTQFGRAAYEHIWIDACLADVEKYFEEQKGDGAANIVAAVEDARFPNECSPRVISKLQAIGFNRIIFVRVSNPDQEVDISNLHDSEKFIPTLAVDFELINKFNKDKNTDHINEFLDKIMVSDGSDDHPDLVSDAGSDSGLAELASARSTMINNARRRRAPSVIEGSSSSLDADDLATVGLLIHGISRQLH